MTMADVYKILFPVLGTLAALVCYWLMFEALAPKMLDRAREQYQKRPIRTFLLGCVITVPIFAVGAGLSGGAGGGGKLVGITMLVLLLTAALAGAAGLARHIGCNLASPSDDAQPWRRVFRGSIILAIAFLLPVVGWLVIFPLTLLSGVGAVALSLRTPKPKAQPVALAVDSATAIEA